MARVGGRGVCTQCERVERISLLRLAGTVVWVVCAFVSYVADWCFNLVDAIVGDQMVESDFELIPGAIDVQRSPVPAVGVEASHVSQIREQFGEVRRGTPKVRFYAVR